jgi:membrane protein required for colicin V production
MDLAALPALPALSWIDWTLLAVLALSVVVGIWRGFVFECLSLAGWVAAWFAAQWVAPELAPYLPVGGRGSALNLAAAFALGFLAALVLWSLLARLIRLLVQATPLSIPDRLLGGGFGVLRGVVLLLAVATVVALTPAAQSQDWRTSQGARWLGLTLQAVKPLLPEPAARLLPA